MSSSERSPIWTRIAGVTVVSLALAFTSACTVRPLYGDAGVASGQGTAATLASIEVNPVNTRQALEVRNHLIFLLTGGGGRAASASMLLDLDVTSKTASAATVQIATDNEPSAGIVTMTAEYRLSDVATGEVISTGERAISSSFDRLRQEFATMRAERDAENRAARELAELLRLAVAQDLEREGRL